MVSYTRLGNSPKHLTPPSLESLLKWTIAGIINTRNIFGLKAETYLVIIQ